MTHCIILNNCQKNVFTGNKNGQKRRRIRSQEATVSIKNKIKI